MVFGTPFVLPLLVLAVAGCASPQPEPNPALDGLRVLPGRFADEPVTKPLVAVEAYIGTKEFFVAYEDENGLVYSGGNWSNHLMEVVADYLL